MIILQNRGSIIHKDGSASIYKLYLDEFAF